MRASVNERIEIVRRDTEVVRDWRELASVELAHLSNLLSMLEPAVEPIDQLVDDRVWLDFAHWALRCWLNFDKHHRRQKTVRDCDRSTMENSNCRARRCQPAVMERWNHPIQPDERYVPW